MRKAVQIETFTGIFTASALDVADHLAVLYGVGKDTMRSLVFSNMIDKGLEKPPEDPRVLLAKTLEVRGGDSLVSSLAIAPNLVEAFALQRGGVLEVEVDLNSYSPEVGLHVLRARTDDMPQWLCAL